MDYLKSAMFPREGNRRSRSNVRFRMTITLNSRYEIRSNIRGSNTQMTQKTKKTAIGAHLLIQVCIR